MTNTRPMPSPNKTNYEGLTIPSSRATMAQDAAQHAYDVTDGLSADSSGNEAVRRYRAKQATLNMFPHWDRLQVGR